MSRGATHDDILVDSVSLPSACHLVSAEPGHMGGFTYKTGSACRLIHPNPVWAVMGVKVFAPILVEPAGAAHGACRSCSLGLFKRLLERRRVMVAVQRQKDDNLGARYYTSEEQLEDEEEWPGGWRILEVLIDLAADKSRSPHRESCLGQQKATWPQGACRGSYIRIEICIRIRIPGHGSWPWARQSHLRRRMAFRGRTGTWTATDHGHFTDRNPYQARASSTTVGCEWSRDSIA